MSIILDKVNFVYSEETAYQIQALKDVNLEIKDGQFIGIIGHTGSGKSTLIQHLNGLMKATSGTIYFHGQDIYEEDFDQREQRNPHPHCATGCDWCSSIRSISFSRRQFLMTSALVRRTRDFPRKRRDCGRLRHCAVSVCRRSFITSRRLISREGRSAVWRSPECLP